MFKREFKRVLITGITGSGGSYLADYIIDKKPEVEVIEEEVQEEIPVASINDKEDEEIPEEEFKDYSKKVKTFYKF